MTPRFCEYCGYQLTPTTQFCPQCGKAAAPSVAAASGERAVPPAPGVPQRAAAPPPDAERALPPAAEAQASPAKEAFHADPAARATPPPVTPAVTHHGNRRIYMVAAVALVTVIALGVLLLGRLPVGSERIERKAVETDTIGEGSAPAAQAPLGVQEQPAPVAPPMTSQTPPNSDILGTTGDPALGTVPPPMTSGTPEPAPAPSSPEGEQNVSSDDAIARVRAAVRDHLNVSDDCISVANQGYVNVGYTLSANDICSGASLGKWRVDARNGDVFRQRPDGRYLRP